MNLKTTITQDLTILFVDDDADEYYLFNEALEQSQLSATIMRAKDGRQLLHLLNTEIHPDIIFMDLNMPYKDGVETLAEVKANEAVKHIPVVIFSTSKNINYIDDCYRNGATFYVVKPETFDEITKVVKKVFQIDWKPNYPQPSRQDFVLEY